MGRRKADSQRSRRRDGQKKAPYTTILLATNGEVTEKAYLNECAKRVNNGKGSKSGGLLHVTVRAVSGHPVKLLRNLKGPHGNVDEFDEVWLVVDVDGEDLSGFLREVSTAGKKFCAVVSNPCFEAWLTDHYAAIRPYQNQRDAQRHYEAVSGTQPHQKYLPADFPWDAVQDACRRLMRDPEQVCSLDEVGKLTSTAMPHLLHRLGLVKPESIR